MADEQWRHIAVTMRGGILELRFHTDGGPMVWTADTHREATEAFGWVNAQTDTKVVVITGTGDAFCRELDLSGFAKLPWEYIWWEGRRMLRNLNDIEVPVIGVFNGPATIHAEIPAMGDFVLASTDAEFADHAHFPGRDTIPGDGVQLVWRELLGPTRAKYWLMTGSVMSAEDGLRIGFVNEVLPRSELNARAWELAEDLARRSVATLRYAKATVSMGSRTDFSNSLGFGLALEGGGYLTKLGLAGSWVNAKASNSTEQ